MNHVYKTRNKAAGEQPSVSDSGLHPEISCISPGQDYAALNHEAGHDAEAGTVTQALSPASAGSAGPIQAAHKDDAPKNPVTEAPGEADFSHLGDRDASGKLVNRYKHGKRWGSNRQFSSDDTSSVAKVGTTSGDAVLKMGVDPRFEQTLATLYNAGAASFDKNWHGAWSFDAPGVRGLSPKEKIDAVQAVSEGHIGSLRNQEVMEANGKTRDLTIGDEVNGAALFQKVSGKSVPSKGYNESKVVHEDQADYSRMMAYTAILDLAAANYDRTATPLGGSVNLDNWIQEEDAHKVHLIDNDYETTSGLRAGAAGRNEWLRNVFQQTRDYQSEYNPSDKANLDAVAPLPFLPGAAQYDEFDGHFNMMARNFGLYLAGSAEGFSNVDRQGIFVAGHDPFNAKKGAQQAIQDLPSLRKTLKKQFKQQRPEGQKGLDPEQEELLERMSILHQIFTDPKKAKKYYEQANSADST